MKTFELITLKGQLNLGDEYGNLDGDSTYMPARGESGIVTAISDSYVALSTIHYRWTDDVTLNIIRSKTGFERDEVTWDNLHVGDQWNDGDEDVFTVTGIIGDVIHYQYINDGQTYKCYIDREDLENDLNNILIQPKSTTPPLEVTMEEVTKKFGRPVKIIKGE